MKLLVFAMNIALALALLRTDARAQDPITVDPGHYKVVFENQRVRVLKVRYGPHEKSTMHYHPENVAVFLNDQHMKFTLADGNASESQDKAGTVTWAPSGKHLPENLGDQPAELIIVELKEAVPGGMFGELSRRIFPTPSQ